MGFSLPRPLQSARVVAFLVVSAFAIIVRVASWVALLALTIKVESLSRSITTEAKTIRYLSIPGAVLSLVDWVPNYWYLKKVRRRIRGSLAVWLPASCLVAQICINAAVAHVFQREPTTSRGSLHDISKNFAFPIAQVTIYTILALSVMQICATIIFFLVFRNSPVRFQLPQDYEPILQGPLLAPVASEGGCGTSGVLASEFAKQEARHDIVAFAGRTHPDGEIFPPSSDPPVSGSNQEGLSQQSALEFNDGDAIPLASMGGMNDRATWNPCVLYWRSFPFLLAFSFIYVPFLVLVDVVVAIALLATGDIKVADWPTLLQLLHPLLWLLWFGLFELLKLKRVPFQKRLAGKFTVAHCHLLLFLVLWAVWVSATVGTVRVINMSQHPTRTGRAFTSLLLALYGSVIAIAWISDVVSGGWIPVLKVEGLRDEKGWLTTVELGWFGKPLVVQRRAYIA